MPTYEYKCEVCGHLFEKFQNITDKPLKNCPECDGKVRRLIGTGSALIFKGSGFYAPIMPGRVSLLPVVVGIKHAVAEIFPVILHLAMTKSDNSRLRMVFDKFKESI